MSVDTSPVPDTASLPAVRPGARPASWGGVVALMAGVFALVTAEFLPASLLSPIASGLHVTEGTAGQAVTATAVVGAIAGLSVDDISKLDSAHANAFTTQQVEAMTNDQLAAVIAAYNAV